MKKTIICLIFFLILIPIEKVSAVNVLKKIDYFGNDIFDGDIHRNFTSNGTERFTQALKPGKVFGGGYQIWSEDWSEMLHEQIRYAADDNQPYTIGFNFYCNLNYHIWFYGEDRHGIGELKIEVRSIENPRCDIDYDGDGSGNNGNGDGTGGDSGGDGCCNCNCNCVIDIPNFDEILGKLDEIKNAIPAPPNWQQVADTMRDTIVPAFRQEMEDMLGRAPSLPTEPVFNNPLQGGIDEPKGNLPGGFEDSGFSAGDLKAAAEEIEFREDESGGFELLDPIGSLPTQEEFKQNIPEEQDLQAPEVPDVSGTAPEPPEQENIAPKPPDVTGTAPNPSEQENIAPKPPDVTGTAPNPSEQENIAPKPPDVTGTAPNPSEQENIAPSPGNQENTAPLPGGDSGTAPIPGESGTTAPIPNTE